MILMGFFYSAGWRYGFMEQFYDGFLKEKGFTTSVSTYVAGMHFGHLGLDLKNSLRMEARWFNSGQVELRDEYGNLVRVRDYTFINFRVYKGDVWFNVMYQPIAGSDVGVSMGFRYRFRGLIFRVDNLGVGTPVKAGMAYMDDGRGIFASLSWELPYGFVYDVVLRRNVMGLDAFISKTNRFDYISGGNSLTSGLAAGFLLQRNRIKLGYVIRSLGALGFQNTVELMYE